MERIVVYIYGFWFWLTRRWRVDAYCDAAATLELVHAYLLRDFISRASTRDRGLLLPFHHEALGILQNHAVETYIAAKRLARFRECCDFVAEELQREELLSRPVPTEPRVTSVRDRLIRNRASRLSVAELLKIGRFLAAKNSGSVWRWTSAGTWQVGEPRSSTRTAEPSKQMMKAA